MKRAYAYRWLHSNGGCYGIELSSYYYYILSASFSRLSFEIIAVGVVYAEAANWCLNAVTQWLKYLTWGRIVSALDLSRSCLGVPSWHRCFIGHCYRLQTEVKVSKLLIGLMLPLLTLLCNLLGASTRAGFPPWWWCPVQHIFPIFA